MSPRKKRETSGDPAAPAVSRETALARTPRTRSRVRATQAEIAERRTTEARARFLEVYAQCGNVSAAAMEAEVGRRTVYDWLVADVEYQAAFNDARDQAADVLEREAHRRAVTGVQRPVYQGGKCVGVVTEYSDKLLETLLRAARPEKFRERSGVELNVTGGGDHVGARAKFQAQLGRYVPEDPVDLSSRPLEKLVESVLTMTLPKLDDADAVRLIDGVFGGTAGVVISPAVYEALRAAVAAYDKRAKRLGAG